MKKSKNFILNGFDENYMKFNIFDEIYTKISKDIKINKKDEKIEVELYDGPSQVLKNKIFIGKNLLIKEDFLFKVFKHELIHLLIFKKYGQLNAFFDEGIAVYYADNEYYKKRYNFNVHEFCKCLLKNNLIYPVKYILDNKRYYGRRHDFRVDFEGASFTGYIINKYGIDKYYSLYKKIIRPTNDKLVCNIYKILNNLYEKDIIELEFEWKNYLKEQIIYNKKTENFILNKNFYKRIPIKYYHCASCGHPLENKYNVCPDCKFNNSFKIKFL